MVPGLRVHDRVEDHEHLRLYHGRHHDRCLLGHCRFLSEISVRMLLFLCGAQLTAQEMSNFELYPRYSRVPKNTAIKCEATEISSARKCVQAIDT